MSTAPSEGFWNRVRDLFHAAAELPQSKRAALLAGEADARVREEVESLLAAHDGTADFLEKSVWDFIDAAEGERLAGSMIGPYRIVRPLGHGGMGTVFLAVRDEPGFAQIVAIKLVRGGGAETLVQRFRQERQILAALEHPNIARLLDGGTTADGLPYLVMEYVDGTPIDAYCREHVRSVRGKLQLFLQLCDAVQYAHRNLVIHRDIKPANVLVTEEGVPKLLDFGIAKLVSVNDRAEAPATRLMTPEYASPEQLLGHPVTTATDVYSLGVLLFELLTNAKPFAAQGRTAESEPSRPSSVTRERELRGDLDNIVLMAMENDPARRYGSVDKLADDVRRYLAGHPVSARRSTFGYRATKFVRRNKLAVGAAIAVVTVVAMQFAATLHQKRIAERRFDEVRSLARSMVFELHDAIAPLPGSTPARELLVRRALVYLDTLAAEASDNTSLLAELARAYVKIGDVQGLPYHANLGDTDGARASYAKALRIATELRENDPADEEVAVLLADVHDRSGWIEQRSLRWPEALREHQAARAIRETLHARGPKADLDLAASWIAVGDSLFIGKSKLAKEQLTMTPQAAYESALRVAERIPENGPHRGDRLVAVGRAHQRLGGLLSYTDLPASLAHHNAALAALEARSNLEPKNSVARRNFADQLVMRATTQNKMIDGQGALEGCTRALEILGGIAAADPKNVEAQHDLAFVHEQRGAAFIHLARWADAERALTEAIAIRRRLVAADPSNKEDLRGIVSLYGSLSKMHQQRGDPANAARYRRAGDELLAELRRMDRY